MKRYILSVLVIAVIFGFFIYISTVRENRVEAVFVATPTFICPIGTIELSSCGYYSVNLHFYWSKSAEDANDQRYCGMVQDTYSYQRSACYQQIAQAKRDANICQYATEHLGCEEQVAYNVYSDSSKTGYASPKVLNDTKVETDLSPIAEEIIAAFRDKNLIAIEPYIDPEGGVSFGNLGYSGTKLMKEDLASALTSSTTYPLRLFAGYNPEQLTFKQFFDRYVWSEYSDKNAAVTAQYYLAMKGRRNIDGTELKISPDAMVEFILPAKNNPEPIRNTFLRLYFEKKQGKWYLIGTTQSDDSTRGLGDAEGI